MQTHFSEAARTKPHIVEADRILRTCVHCGFCNATCPTYQLLGDERDGPRGRIYLIKELLESDDGDARITEETQLHLDRCLSCRSCETTCPSGVEYHKLLDIGRAEIDRRVGRRPGERVMRLGLRTALVEPKRFQALLALGQTFRPLAPQDLRDKIPARQPQRQPYRQQRPDPARHDRQMLILEGCVQPGLAPNTNDATARVLDRLGIGVKPAREAGCCGAIDFHLNAQAAGRERMRANIDAWWPLIENGGAPGETGVEAIVQTASGCGAFVKEYGEMLADDPEYATKARRVSELAKDLVEILREEDLEALGTRHPAARLAFHCPCTLQHAQKLGGAVEGVLMRLGFTLAPVQDSHLCCGSAGTYSITQPTLAKRLRDNKLDALEAQAPDTIVTANIGCQSHLNGAGRTPVRHWIELVDECLDTA
ncbi:MULTISPECIES: glycolate oxidase subunit GlcF [Salinicola]|uniref:Glycolate oxidase iron-sulfur subunit n=1 Tax=Salinicola socius TaxID=404433 RepID=A0A1Q8SXE9_9GAMM|nr:MULTISPECIES: glycolate oxidase subunit GlcF [Salinicola]OLO06119.1 glycolate oxidase iron-sulfur subunit [Salinicola socius]